MFPAIFALAVEVWAVEVWAIERRRRPASSVGYRGRRGHRRR
jgi:hypothetical protein